MDREKWTKKLERIVRDVEGGKLPADIKAIYVFGSYARGAVECRDLDLIVVHDAPPKSLTDELTRRAEATARTTFERLCGPQKRFHGLMSKALRRPGEDMDILIGQELASILNGRSITRSDLVLLWSTTDRDWRGNLDVISVDPNACSAPRDMFIAPKLAQASPEDVIRATQLIHKQVLKLTRIAVDTLTIEKLSDKWTEEFARRRWGKKLLSLVPVGFFWLAMHPIESVDVREHGNLWDPDRRICVQLGKFNLFWMARQFERSQILERQCLVPFFRKAYPKELFVFERGPAWGPKLDWY